jgi:hypothetical protein
MSERKVDAGMKVVCYNKKGVDGQVTLKTDAGI